MISFKTKIFTLSFLLLSSCSQIVSDSYKKENTDFYKYNKIAVLNIDSNIEQIPTKEITEIVALKFMNKGFNVIQNQHLKIMIDQDSLRITGFSANTRKMLKIQDINAVITGFLSGYQKTINKDNLISPTQTNNQITNNASVNECKASLSLIMFDVNSGETIWSARGLKIQQSENLTTDIILNEIIKDISDKIPNSKENKKWFWIF